MDGDRSGGRLTACIEGAVLLVMLGALALGLLAVQPAGVSEEGDGIASAVSTERDVQGGVLVAPRPLVHLVLLVDPGNPLAQTGEFAAADASIGWISSLEVIEASGSVLRGLEEATRAAAAPCFSSPCSELVVLDLRTDPAAR